MVVPFAGRAVAAVAGGVLVLTVWISAVGTLITPRQISNWLTRLVDKTVNKAFTMVVSHIADYRQRDRVLAAQAPAILIGQLVAWLGMSFIGFTLLLWPFVTGGTTRAFTVAGSSMFTLGFAEPAGAAPAVIVFAAAATGLVIVTLQIAYLPTLYAAFNRRETEVALLNARAGVPSWGPELLARTHYALGSGSSTIDTLPDLFAQWERFAADVAESHTTYLPLVRFRSPRPKSSWITALLSVLDASALYLALSPKLAPEVPARLCLRSGFVCLTDIARGMRLKVAEAADPDAGISLTYDEFLDAVARLEKVDFPIERSPEQAWPDFVGWRVNYEQAAYAIAYEIDAVPALWSGPRKWPSKPIPFIRPFAGRAPKSGGQPVQSGRRSSSANRR